MKRLVRVALDRANLFRWKALRLYESILGGNKDLTFQHSLKLHHRQAVILSAFILNVNTFCIRASFQMAAIILVRTFLPPRETRCAGRNIHVLGISLVKVLSPQ